MLDAGRVKNIGPMSKTRIAELIKLDKGELQGVASVSAPLPCAAHMCRSSELAHWAGLRGASTHARGDGLQGKPTRLAGCQHVRARPDFALTERIAY